jgi:hypothetical protein
VPKKYLTGLLAVLVLILAVWLVPMAFAASGSTTHKSPRVAHIVIIVMENKTSSEIIGSPQAPYLNALARRYSLAADYSALLPSGLSNYIALTSGSNQGITDYRTPPTAGYAVAAINIADRIQSSHRTWMLYAESIPSPGYASGNTTLYTPGHVPFLYYRDILYNTLRRRSHIVSFAQLPRDFRAASTTPDYVFITPNLRHDMHDAPVAVGDAWLKRWVPRILASPAFTSTPSLLVITWDEGVGSDQHVATILAGSAVKRHFTSAQPYDPYSLLHTIETLWRLRPLTQNDAQASTMLEFLR